MKKAIAPRSSVGMSSKKSPYRSSLKVVRTATTLKGKHMAESLPPGFALVVRKANHRAHGAAIRKVYREYGIKPLWSGNLPYTKYQIKRTYEKVFARKPEITAEVMKELSASNQKDLNSKVELVYVPKSTIAKLQEMFPDEVNGPKTAMKKIGGVTDPMEALRIQEETGMLTIRGEAARRARDVKGVPQPTISNNVVHIPAGSFEDFSKSPLAHGEDEFYNHLAILMSEGRVEMALRKYHELRREGRLEK